MSNNPSTPDRGVDVGALEQRIQQLHDTISQQAQGQRRRCGIILIGGGLVFLMSIGSLASLTANASKLDAPALMQIMRQRLQQQLPDHREELREYLEAEAPNIIATGLETLAGAVPEIRGQAVRHMREALKPLTQELERELVAQWKKRVNETCTQLAVAYPDTSQAERLQMLIAAISDQFKKNVETTLDAMYPQYAAEMNRLHAYLIDLQRKSPSELTEKERLHKEIIVTLLRLAIQSEAPK